MNLEKNLQELLSRLPLTNDVANNSIELEGIFLKQDAETVRLLSGKVCLEINSSDLLKIEELKTGQELVENSSKRVRIFLRKEARLMGAYAFDLYIELIPKNNRPFIPCVRETSIRSKSNGHFKKLETEFLFQKGLLNE